MNPRQNKSAKSTMLSTCLLFALALGASTLGAAEPGAAWTVPSTDQIEALLAERMQHNGVGVVVGVVDRNGARVTSRGRSGADNGRPLDGDTIFQIGSVTKILTTLLLADMAAKGEVHLDDPVQQYLPSDVVLRTRERPITLGDLATHRSGLPSMPDNFDLHGQPDPVAAYSEAQLDRFLVSWDPPYPPGARSAYSNLGVALLGRVLARKERMDYETLLKRRILEPLDMESTAIHLTREQEQRVAPGHDPYLAPVESWEMRAMPASGSLRSTANDLLKLIAAYLEPDHSPLGKAIEFQLDEARGQGLAWSVAENGVLSHSGGKEGYRSGIVIDRSRGTGAVVLANARTDDQPIALARYLVTGRELPPAPAAPVDRRVEVATEVLDRYAGTYRFPSGQVFEVARHGQRLIIRYPGGSILVFAPVSDGDFFYVGGNDELTFLRDPSGRVTGLELWADGRGLGSKALAERVDI